MKYVVFTCRSIKILISNWHRTRKFSQPATGREDSCFWLFSPCSRVGHILRPIFLLRLVKIWQVSSCGKFRQHLESCLLWQLNWSWQSFVSTCDVFNFLFPLDVQNEIQLLSEVFCYSWLVCLLGFWLRYVTCQIFSSSCTTTRLSRLITECLKLVHTHCTAYC